MPSARAEAAAEEEEVGEVRARGEDRPPITAAPAAVPGLSGAKALLPVDGLELLLLPSGTMIPPPAGTRGTLVCDLMRMGACSFRLHPPSTHMLMPHS